MSHRDIFSSVNHPDLFHNNNDSSNNKNPLLILSPQLCPPQWLCVLCQEKTKDEWKWSTTISGALCVMTDLTVWMAWCSVRCWASRLSIPPLLPPQVPSPLCHLMFSMNLNLTARTLLYLFIYLIYLKCYSQISKKLNNKMLTFYGQIVGNLIKCNINS